MKNFTIFLIFIFIPLSIQENNWTMINNSINIHTYSSNLTNEQRENYYYWIGLRNSFYFSENSNQLEKLVKYFTPEEENYFLNLYKFSIPGLILAGAALVTFIVYLVKRFLLKGCLGPKNVIKSYHYTTYFFIIFGCLIGIVFHSFMIYNAAKSNSHIKKMITEVERQKELMKQIYEEDILKNKELAEKDKKSTFNIDLSIYGEDTIKKDFDQLQTKLESFETDLYKIQTHKFNYQIASLVVFLVLSLVGVSGYWLRRDYIPLISSILLILFAAPILAIAGLETTWTFLSVDFCSTIGNSIISGITPSENTGLGSYLSCPSKETMRTISTAIYQYIINFDALYEKVNYNITYNDYFSVLNLGNDKRDNDHFRELIKNASLVEINTNNTRERTKNEELRDDLMHAFSIFININYILAGLLSMTSCFTAKNSINFIEENYCYQNHEYMFLNIVFSVCAGVGFIITAVGINKLIIVMKNRYSHALRGKKEFNTDIITEDDED